MLDIFVKFSGRVEEIENKFGVKGELLNENISIFKIEYNQLSDFINCEQIKQVEIAQTISFSDNNSFLNSVCASQIDLPPENLNGKGIIIAILDSGIDIFHPDFIDDDNKTRILYVWDQNGKDNPPEDFDFGTEYTSDDINLAIKNEVKISELDLDGHGTAVAGICCGNGRSSNYRNKGIAPESSIISVRLLSPSNPYSTNTSDLSKGIKYVINRANKLNMPVVINISYGTNMGAHDGQSLFEQYLDTVCENPNTCIVVATGNEGTSRHHFKGEIKTGEILDISFTLKKNFKEFTIFLADSFYDETKFQLINSSGEKSDVINLFQSNNQIIFFKKVKIRIYLEQPTPYYEGENITFTFFSFEGFIPQDIWTIRVFAGKIYDGRIDAWLPITEGSGSETQFLNPSPETTLTIPSTSFKVISVGGYNSLDGNFAEFSGRGYTRSNFISPDIIAPSVSVISTKLNGSYSTYTGTSFSSPFVSGACAIMMQWGIINGNDPLMYGQRLKAFLKLGAYRNEGISYPNDKWGYGVLCIKSSLDYAKKYIRTENSNEILEKYYLFRGLDLNEDNKENFNPVTSEEYMDFIINYDESTLETLKSIDDIHISSILKNKYAIIHVSKQTYEYYKNNLNDYVFAEKSMICALASDNYSSITASGITAIQDQQFLKLRGSGTLVAIVDDGIDLKNNCLRYENGDTKVLYFWDQESNKGNPPENFTYGTEFTSEMINEYISNETSYSSIEDNGHGTFLSSVISGRRSENSTFEGASPDSNILFVKLKKAKNVMKEYSAVFSNSPSFESSDIMNAVEYILQIARKLNRPVVINIPLQTNEGAHDGLSYFEQYLSEVSTINGVGVVVPVGNQGNKGGHVQIKIKQSEEPYKVEFSVSDGDPGFIINLWTSVPDRVSVSVVTPLGNVVEREKFTINAFREYNFVLEGTEISVQYIFPDIKNGNQNIIIKLVNPTPGLWSLNVFGDLVVYGTVDIWLPISQFISQGTSFLSPSIENTVTVPSTSLNVISVGAYDFIDQSIYISSGRGQLDCGKINPDFVAPGVDVSGVYPNNLSGKMTGTGVASAIVTGASSLIMEWGFVKGNDTKINSMRLRSYLVLGCSQNDNTESPNNVWGYGKINLIETFRKIR